MHTEGYEALAADLAETQWPQIEKESGLTRAQLEQVAEACQVQCHDHHLRHGPHAAQHRHLNVRLIADLLLLRGNFGKPGAGICPLGPFQRAG